MKKCLLFCWLALAAQSALAQSTDSVRLIVRSDDIGMCHAVNLACLQVYNQGVSRTVEVLPTAPWLMEAVAMLRTAPGYDVGIHLCLTSEWETLRWRPLTPAKSLVDADGYLPAFVWPNPGSPQRAALLNLTPNLAEMEAELRAQIEMTKRLLPQASHLSCHMAFEHGKPEWRQLVEKLAQEYGLPLALPASVKGLRFGGNQKTPAQKEAELADLLQNLAPGTYLLVEHPGYDIDEMRTIGHRGYENVGADRQGVTQAFTSPRVWQVVQQRGIRLMSVGEVLREGRK
jgi:chitin disaccharide deacetylase